MKFNEVKPFLMAGFKIDCMPYPQKPEHGYWELIGNKFYRCYQCYQLFGDTSALLKNEWSLNKIENIGDKWKVLDADPQKITRSQAEKLMDAGYKVTTVCLKSGFNGFYYKKDNKVWYKSDYSDHEAFAFDIIDPFTLYDNEPVKKEIVTKPYQYKIENGIYPLLRNQSDLQSTLEKYWGKLTKETSISLFEEPKMNQSFAKIKPYVLAGFKFKSSENSCHYYQYNLLTKRVESFHIMTGDPCFDWSIVLFENAKNEENIYLIPNQQSHAKNLNYEQAKVLIESGYRVKIIKSNGFMECEYPKIDIKFLPNSSEAIYELLDDLPTTETTMLFDFKRAMDYLKDGKKVTHEDLDSSYVYIMRDSDGDLVDKDGDCIDPLNELIFSDKWKLYEPKKLQLEILEWECQILKIIF